MLYTHEKPRGRRQAVSIEVVVRDDVGRKVKVHYGTELDGWKDGDEIETLSPPIEGRLHLEYTPVVPFGRFYSSASMWIGQKLDDWNLTNWIFTVF